jgi:hypothetical protein
VDTSARTPHVVPVLGANAMTASALRGLLPGLPLAFANGPLTTNAATTPPRVDSKRRLTQLKGLGHSRGGATEGARSMKHGSKARAAALALLSLILASPSGSSFAASTSEDASALKPFRVDELENVVLPRDSDVYVGRTVHLKTDKSETIRMNLGYRFIARIDGRIDAVVGGIRQFLPAGSILTQRKASGGRISSLPVGALILCDRAVQHNFGQTMASAATLGIT